MKKVLAGVLAAAGLVALTACGSSAGAQKRGYVGGDQVFVFTQTVGGRTVPCMAWRKALSCDWEAGR